MKPLLALSLLTLIAMPVFSETIKPDEHVQFVRGLAYFTEEGVVEADIAAWVYEHERRPGARTLFAKLTGLERDSFSPSEAENFERRSQLFRFDSERGKRLRLQLSAGNHVTLPVTDADGMARSRVRLGCVEQLDLQHATGQAPLLRFQAALAEGDSRVFAGELVLMPAQGLSVISDIDDTIKHSQVRDRAELIRNTFVRDFKAVPGMAALYQHYAAQADSTRFHYLSSSPHQLYPVLDAFLLEQHFPLGSVHLRHIDVSDELFGDGDSSRQHKLGTLRQLLEQFPQREFLLIGDSGEADPEIYAEIARRYPEQVVGIYIRNVSDEDAQAARYGSTFAGLPAALWQVFSVPDELAR